MSLLIYFWNVFLIFFGLPDFFLSSSESEESFSSLVDLLLGFFWALGLTLFSLLFLSLLSFSDSSELEEDDSLFFFFLSSSLEELEPSLLELLLLLLERFLDFCFSHLLLASLDELRCLLSLCNPISLPC